jgi:hypothetical protein
MLLQNLVKAKGAPIAGGKSTHPSQVVLQDGLSPCALGIVFCVHPSQGTLEHCQSILPCGDGSSLAFQLPLLSKELLPQLDGRHQCRHHA